MPKASANPARSSNWLGTFRHRFLFGPRRLLYFPRKGPVLRSYLVELDILISSPLNVPS